MIINETYNEWIDQRTIEYCNAVENLLEPALELEYPLSLQERTDLICSVIKLGTVYMEDVVAHMGDELLNRIIAELKRKGFSNE